MKEILLYSGKKVIVDDFNYDRIKNLKLHDSGNTINISWHAPRNKGKQKTGNIALSKIILLTDAPIVDHKDRNYLNFQINNLRPCTRQQNNFNCSKYKRRKTWRSSIYKGVEKRDNGKWRARIKLDRKQMYLGQYNTEKEAAEAYNKKAIELFKDFANINIL